MNGGRGGDERERKVLFVLEGLSFRHFVILEICEHRTQCCYMYGSKKASKQALI